MLELAELAAPAVDERTALVRVMAASINPSDVKNVAGAMKQTTLPRIPGRDYAGVVEAGPAAWIRAEVWGTGGDTGVTRDGSHAELIAVPVASLRRKPDNLSFDQAASVGVNYIAAWCGIEAAGLKAGETALLIGAGGGVGAAAALIARRLGARVIGADRRAPLPDAPIRAIAEKLIIGAEDLPAEVRAATGGKGADFVFDLVGGVMFRNAVNSLALRTRDALFGLALTVGAGGVLADLIDDHATLLLPASREEIEAALHSLKLARLLDGYRGAARGDWPALVGSVESIARYAAAHRDTLIELDVNPLLVFATGSGGVAVDALIRLSEEVL